MNVDQILENLRKAADLLKDRNTYYAVVLAFLGYWIYQKDQAIIEVKADSKIALASVEKEKEVIQQKLDDKDCAKEVRAYKELLDGLQVKTSNELEEEKKAAQIEHMRTVELQNTYEQLKNHKE